MGLYNNLATYGEDPIKPIIWLSLILFLGTLYWYLFYSIGYNVDTSTLSINSFNYTTTGLESGRMAANNSVPEIKISTPISSNALKPIERTLVNIVSLNEKPILADLIIRLTSLPVIGAIGLALRRKIERRFRH